MDTTIAEGHDASIRDLLGRKSFDYKASDYGCVHIIGIVRQRLWMVIILTKAFYEQSRLSKEFTGNGPSTWTYSTEDDKAPSFGCQRSKHSRASPLSL